LQSLQRSRHAIAACAVLVAFLAPPRGVADAATAEARSLDRFDTIVVDAGHGGEDHGARGVAGLEEKELVLDVALRLSRRLRDRGLRVVLTRSGDTFVPLEERFAIANDADADLFVSVHANAAHDADVRGTETYFLANQASDADARRVADRENAAFEHEVAALIPDDPVVAILGDLMTAGRLEESSDFAHLAEAELAAVDPHSRGVKQARFVVLQGVQMPSALIEIGFVTHREDERRLRRSAARDEIADALTRAVLAFGERYDRRRGAGAGPAATGEP
jgi:N-acetylmuramoyl-L-alanine amidase